MQSVDGSLSMRANGVGDAPLRAQQLLVDRIGQLPGATTAVVPDWDQPGRRRADLAERQGGIFPPDAPDGTRP